MNDLHFKTLTELSEQIRMRSISPVEVTRHLLERINEFDPMADSLDSVGPMARSASDAAAILGVVAGSDSNDPTTLKASVPNYANQISDDIRGLRIGIDRVFATGGVHDEVVAALSETEAAFIELGADVREVTVPFSDRMSDIFLVLCSAEAAAAHKETYSVHASEYGNELAELIERGRKTSALQLAESRQERVRLVDSVSTMFREIDLLLTPTLPFPVPRLDSIDFKRMTVTSGGAGSNPEDLYSACLRFTSLFNCAGNPAISFPTGFSSSGMPIGMQLAGRHLEEELLLRTVHAFQKSTQWHTRHPVIPNERGGHKDHQDGFLNRRKHRGRAATK